MEKKSSLYDALKHKTRSTESVIQELDYNAKRDVTSQQRANRVTADDLLIDFNLKHKLLCQEESSLSKEDAPLNSKVGLTQGQQDQAPKGPSKLAALRQRRNGGSVRQDSSEVR